MAAKTYFQLWYEKNRKKLAKARKERYHTDKKYRKARLEACRQWRQENKPWLRRRRPVRQYLLIGEFAASVGCSPETLRNLERSKLLPVATDGVSRRRYNPANIGVVQDLVQFRREVHYAHPQYRVKLEKLVTKVRKHWKGVE